MLKSFIALIATTSVRVLTGLLLFVLMAHQWGAQAYGQFMYFFSLATLVTLVCEFGFTQQILKEVGAAPDKTSEMIGTMLGAKLWLTLGMWITVAIGLLFAHLDQAKVFCLLMLVLASTSLSYADFFSTVLRARGHYLMETRITVGANLVLFALVAAAVFTGREALLATAAAFVVARGIHLGWMLHVLRQQGVRPGADLDRTRAWQTIRRGLPYGVDVAVGNAFASLDGVLVTHFMGYAANGVYQAAARFYQGACLLPPIFASLFLPRMARMLADRDDASMRRLLQRLYVSIAVMGAAAFLAFDLLSPLLARIYPDPALAAAKDLMPWFGLLVFVRFLAAGQGITVTAANGQRFRTWIFAVALALLPPLAMVLMKPLALPGVIVTMTLIYCGISLAFWNWLARRQLGGRYLMLACHLVAVPAFATHLIISRH